MPKLIRLYIVNVAIGFAISAAFLAMLVGLDVAGFRHLILGTEMGYVAGAMFFVANGIIFAGVQFGIAVMRLAEDDDTPRGGTRQHNVPAPVRVAQNSEHRSRPGMGRTPRR